MQLITKRAELTLGSSYWAFPKDNPLKPVKVSYKRMGQNMMFATPGRLRMVTETFEVFDLVGPIEPEVPPNLEKYKRKHLIDPPANLCMEVELPYSEETVHLKMPLLQTP